MSDRIFMRLLLTQAAVTLLSAVAALLLPGLAVYIIIIAGMLSAAAMCVYRYIKEKRAQALVQYLTRMCDEDKLLEPAGCEEGSFGVLKSEIYKTGHLLREKAEQSHRDKQFLEDTLSDISHQLKTPLTSMMIMTDLLSDPSLPEEKRERFTASISGQLTRMEWLVKTLLTMSRLDAGTLVLTPCPINLRALVEEILPTFEPTAELKGLRLEITGEATAKCDRAWTGEALSNIIKNCIEHTGGGGHVQIAISRTGLYSRVVIRDDGCGIAPEELPNIFDRFYKGKNSSNESVGIGLALSKKLIVMQNGTISAASRPGEGSAFTVTLYD